MADKITEAWDAYEATIPDLEEARGAHDDAYRNSLAAYRRWKTLLDAEEAKDK